ncbi:MAG: alpha-amylase [Lachnospiraceae bacterium]|nr:alpha-amylase [Lachnospiraceae bacterium]
MTKKTDHKLKNQMIYQIFVRNYSPEGTFSAVEKDLKRIKDLGTDIVYFLPIYPIGVKNRKGSLGSPYAISDYRAINPEYGRMDDFTHLVDAIHENGMKCMIDIVYNHTSPDSVLSKEHPEWFYHKEDGSFGNRVGDWTDIIDLDYSNSALWDYQIETLEFWADIVDGFRCDVAPLVPIDFWERARKVINSKKPGFIWLAESVEPEFITHLRSRHLTALSDSELYRAFDICYDYDIYGKLTGYIEGRNDLSEYCDSVNRQEHIYPADYVKIRFIENHDQSRAAFLFPDPAALKNITAFSFFQKGAAFVYAGQEFGASHLPTLFDKDTVKMVPENGTDLTGLIRKLAGIKKNSIFSESIYEVSSNKDDVIVSVHSSDDKKAVGIFSLKGLVSNIRVPLPDGIYKNELTEEKIEVFRGMLDCKAEPIIVITGK